MNLEGRAAFVTGGASGAGLGMVKAFLARGMAVAVADVLPAHLDAARNFLPADAPCRFIQLDVTDREAFAHAATEAEAALGPISILCNNAGVGLLGSIAATTARDWDWVTAVNFSGVFNGIDVFLPLMRRHGEGHIVNTSSIGGILPGPGAAAYLAAKAGVVGLSEAVCCDLRSENIGVTIVLLGPTASNIHDVSKQMAAQRGVEALASAHVSEIDKPIIAGGMDPLEVGHKVAAAIERNQLYLFTHPEFRHALRQRFDAIMSAFGLDEGDEPAYESYGFPTFNPLFAEIIDAAEKGERSSGGI